MAILRIFLWGALITLPTFFAQLGLSYLLKEANLSPFLTSLIYWFIVISLTEELFKYAVVRLRVLNSADLDEPMDIVMYMVVAALGFAALENVIYLFVPPIDMLSVNDLIGRTMAISFIRFIGATFLHTLCSAVVGYSLVISLRDQKNRLLEVGSGIAMATILHGIYDFSIMQLEGASRWAIPAVSMLVLAFLVFSNFKKLKKIKSVTILNPKH